MFSIVYNPVLNQLWTAKKGHGAEYNGKKVRSSHGSAVYSANKSKANNAVLLCCA